MADIRVGKGRGGYVLMFGATSFSPSDATTYYTGAVFAGAPDTTQGSKRVYFPKPGRITSAQIFFYNNTSNGSNESSTVNIRINNATDVQVSTAVDNSSQASVVANPLLSQLVAAGDYAEIKWVTPTWATNPVGVRIIGTVYVEV